MVASTYTDQYSTCLGDYAETHVELNHSDDVVWNTTSKDVAMEVAENGPTNPSNSSWNSPYWNPHVYGELEVREVNLRLKKQER